ncbi:MAG: CbtB domain-containing protein [Dehalococcoidia bacterium]|nr:CbtB domain-containing protein [Dehalococcoidia bacterium]
MNTAVDAKHKGFLGLAPGYWALLLAALAGLFLIGIAQGEAINALAGQATSQQGLLHELFHDVRHAAGFPCH